MSQEIPKTISDRGERRESVSTRREYVASTRVSPGSYISVLFVVSFTAAFLIYLEMDIAGMLLFGFAMIILPLLALSDRIGFDGKRLYRTGFLTMIWTRLTGIRDRLKISDVEQVETQAVRALKRGRNVKYRFSTTVRGKGSSFTFASGGESYRQMVKALLPLLPDNVLDSRSIELRDYLIDPKEALQNAETSRIPSADVLEGSFERSIRERPRPHPSTDDLEAHATNPLQLRQLANQLRLSGFLLQAMEAFRRALIVDPENGWLLLECGRCLHSLAGSEKNGRLERRSLALMRLAEQRAGMDSDLLVRVGESYFQAGDWRRAGRVFRRVSDGLGETFRSVRGMAEMALREGKIAHVIHQFSAADRLADSSALRRWARGEADYFSRLNDDEDYLELEISRMNLIERLERYQKTSLRAVLFGFPLILIGVVAEQFTLANIGWAISAIAIAFWFGMVLIQKFISSRIPPGMEV
jgi:tetratricopeptide (TPR) repeat protein